MAGTLKLVYSQLQRVTELRTVSVLTWMQIPRHVWPTGCTYRGSLKAGKKYTCTLEKQVAILYAVVKGVLTDVAVEDIQAYEEGLYTYLDSDAQGA